ncbi:MAG TPA: malto-oligosyltrehalose synthase [Thermomicrobiales bacterium]|nr:malto-oligosyltrehalose synthase [Thermomicrobiales bacterium]
MLMAETETITEPRTLGEETTDDLVTRDPAIEATVAALVAELDVTPRVPGATYRLQLNAGFGFRDARRVVPYLAELGISGLYAAPYLSARPGSTHGYDVDDYSRLNPELGSDADYDALIEALDRHGLGHVMDFVPNHMGIGRGTNRWWMDVLENGRSSPFATFFDIDWDPLKPDLRGKVLLPFLGDQYGVVLEQGELKLRFDPASGTLSILYYENVLPVAPPSYTMVLRRHLDELTDALPEDDPDLLEFQSIITALERLPGQHETDPELIAERQREQIVAKRRLADVAHRSAPIRESIERSIVDYNGTVGEPESFDLLDELLEAQSYRLAFWRVAAEEINYRRFFAINELAGVRQEEPEVFEAAHAFTLGLLAERRVTGLRLDHVDGLYDPAGYFATLQRAYLLAICHRRWCARGQQPATDQKRDEAGPAPPVEWSAVKPRLNAALDTLVSTGKVGLTRPLYVLVEKILEHGEELPAAWAVHGTTGYEFANAVGGLFVDSANRRAFDELYSRFIQEKINFADMVYACKRLMMRVALASEVGVLANSLDRIAEQNRRSRDYTLNSLRDAMREIIACFLVYRTYITCDDESIRDVDRRSIEAAVKEAKRRNPASDPTAFDFVRDVLLEEVGTSAADQVLEQCRFAMRFQQLTGPVMAKGLEDTAFYRYNRLAALNEVGGDPTRFGLPVAAFHRQNLDRLRRWPDAMLSTSTHDTKRSEDVRARMDVLSEIPREWRAAVNRWTRMNRKHKTRVNNIPAPDRNDEYLLYQTLLGAWPLDPEGEDLAVWDEFVDRIAAYMDKALREAQVHTSWVNPNEEYDAATAAFVRRLLDRGGENLFLADIATLRKKVAFFGAINALGQQVLKLTSPGVPDIYQGTELWDFSLVDPDNRRPVDYQHRSRMLQDLQRSRNPAALARDLLDGWCDGRIKLYVTHRVLKLRAERRDLFGRGEYIPLDATGSRADHVVAFSRQSRGEDATDREIVVVVPRLIHGLTGGDLVPPVGEEVWGATLLETPHVPPGTVYRDIFTGQDVAVETVGGRVVMRIRDVLSSFPVAVLERREG